MLSNSKVFLICCLAFIIGVAVASFLPVELAQNDLWWFAGIAGCGVILFLFWTNKKIRLAVFVGLFLFLGIWRYAIGLPINSPDKIWHYNDKTVVVAGIVVDDPDLRKTNQKLEISAMAIRGPLLQNVDGKILVTTNLYPRYNYGDELELKCELKTPKKFSGFSYDRYLARHDIYSVCYYPKIKILNRGGGNFLYENIFKIKNRFQQIVNYGLSEPEASLAQAMILGNKRGISESLREKFSKSGISHIIAISGMHISILAALVMSILLGIGFSRKKSFLISCLFLLFYLILIGLPVSAMRAGLMGFLVLLAMNLGRLNKITSSLALAAAVLLLINPKLLRDDIGFQLSFLAVLGIVYCYPLFRNIKIASKYFKAICAVLFITISAQIFTLPIIALNFSQISIISPISNLLILWALPVLIFFALSALVLSLIFPNFAPVFFLPSSMILKYIVFITDILIRLPYAYVEIDYLWPGWIVIYYGIVAWCLYRIKSRMSALDVFDKNYDK